MNYKKGDKFICEVAKVNEGNELAYEMRLKEGETSLWIVSDKFLDQLQPCTNSAEEAWETAKQILFEKEFTHDVLNEIFGTMNHYAIMRDLKPDEVKAKIEAWEKKKQIEVGCILKGKASGMQCIVTKVDGDAVELLWQDGLTGKKTVSEIAEQFEPTGRKLRIIEKLIKEIGK